MDDIYNNQKFLQKLREKKCYNAPGPSESSNLNEQQSRNYLSAINRTFDDCRIVNHYENTARGSSLFWNPENKSFEVKRYYLPKFKEKIYQRDEYYKKILNINEQLLQSSSSHPNDFNIRTNTVPLNDRPKRVEQKTSTDVKDQVLRSTSSWFRNQYSNNFLDPKFKARLKKYKAVSFNPEVQVIYMIRKKSDNEVFLRGIEILNKEQDQQMRNYIMRSTYSKKKLLY